MQLVGMPLMSQMCGLCGVVGSRRNTCAARLESRPQMLFERTSRNTQRAEVPEPDCCDLAVRDLPPNGRRTLSQKLRCLFDRQIFSGHLRTDCGNDSRVSD